MRGIEKSDNDVIFSVVIPVYNVELYLRECIDSVLRQKVDNIQIILVDDGSKDNSGKICDEYVDKDCRVKVIHKENGGLSSARNAGIQAAVGKYVMFLDSDDYYHDDALTILRDKVNESEIDCIAFGCQPFSDGAPISYGYHREKTKFDVVRSGVETLKEMMLIEELHVNAGLYMFRRAILEEINLSFYDKIIHEDELFSFLLFIQCESMSVIENKLYMRRYRPGSIMDTRKYKQVFLGLVTTYREICNFMDRKRDLNVTSVCKMRLRVLFNQLQNLYSRVPSDERKDIKNLYDEMISLTRKNISGDSMLVWIVCYFNDFYNFYKDIKGRLKA